MGAGRGAAPPLLHANTFARTASVGCRRTDASWGRIVTRCVVRDAAPTVAHAAVAPFSQGAAGQPDERARRRGLRPIARGGAAVVLDTSGELAI